jgi:hypothetical protein
VRFLECLGESFRLVFFSSTHPDLSSIVRGRSLEFVNEDERETISGAGAFRKWLIKMSEL